MTGFFVVVLWSRCIYIEKNWILRQLIVGAISTNAKYMTRYGYFVVTLITWLNIDKLKLLSFNHNKSCSLHILFVTFAFTHIWKPICVHINISIYVCNCFYHVLILIEYDIMLSRLIKCTKIACFGFLLLVFTNDILIQNKRKEIKPLISCMSEI